MTNDLNLSKKVHYTLRIAAAMCFIGHGSFGVVGKAIWCNYFAVFGIDTHLSYQLMPYVGGADIFMGIILLVFPIRAILLWLVVWGGITALLRPLSGEPFPEFIERAGNFGAPLALLILGGFPKNIRQAFSLLHPDTELNEKRYTRTLHCLRVVSFLLLAGHGWLNMMGKNALLDQYTALGFSNPGNVAQIIGMAEIISAFIILIRPVRQFVLLIFIWKVASELFYPQYEIFEWIERGGSYGALLALWFLTEKKFSLKTLSPSNIFFKRIST
jgi:hypothetical protein